MLPEDAIRAADLASRIETVKDEERPHRELRLGFDTQARLLESVVLCEEAARRWSFTQCLPADSLVPSVLNAHTCRRPEALADP